MKNCRYIDNILKNSANVYVENLVSHSLNLGNKLYTFSAIQKGGKVLEFVFCSLTEKYSVDSVSQLIKDEYSSITSIGEMYEVTNKQGIA